MWRRTLAVVAATVLAAITCLIPDAAVTQDRIQVRATSVPPDEFEAKLAALSQPVRLSITPPMTAEDAMKLVCGGSFSTAYRDLAIAANGGTGSTLLVPSKNRRPILLPPCPRVQRNRSVTVAPGDDLSTLLQRELGARPDTQIYVCDPPAKPGGPDFCRLQSARDAVAARNGSDKAGLDRLSPGRVLQFPFTSQWTMVRLKDDIDPADAIRQLMDAAHASPAGDGLIQAERATNLTLALPGDDPSCPPDGPAPPAWPFDYELVKSAINDAMAYWRSKSGTPPPRTIVRIADTGIDGLPDHSVIPWQAISPNKQELDACGKNILGCRKDNNLPGNMLQGDVVGFDPDGLGNVQSVQIQPERWHGAQVADLALGGHEFHTGYSQVYGLIGLTFARIFQQIEGRVLANASTLELSVSSRRPEPDITIINISVGSDQAMPAFVTTLDALPPLRRLVVIAAGNDGKFLGDSAIYPAYFGRDNRSSLMVVGGHAPGPEFRRTGTSNYGADYVDLLAPGCRIKPLSPDLGDSLTGTSFAAPLVTFTAALLHSFGLTDPADIRIRLQASTRWVSNEVAASVRFGGILDIPVALRLFDDVVRPADGTTPVVGRWMQDGPVTLCDPGDGDEEPIQPRLILRIRVEHPADGPILHIWRRDASSFSPIGQEMVCRPNGPDGPRLLLPKDGQRPFQWKDIASFVPAYDRSDRRIPPPAAAGAPSTGQPH